MSQEAAAPATTTQAPTSGFWAEIETLKTPVAKPVGQTLKPGTKAPTSPQIPLSDGRPAIILFLRHCGCPFAEKNFKALTALSEEYPQIQFYAVSHSTQEGTDNWIIHVGGSWSVKVIVDTERDLYAAWGLGMGSVWNTLGPRVLWSTFRLGKKENIWNRPTEVGTRWQNSGAFAVDGGGVVRWAHPDGSADDVPDLRDAVTALGVEDERKK